MVSSTETFNQDDGELNALQRRLAELEAENARLTNELQQYEAIISNTGANIFIKDRQGQYLFINSRFEELFQLNMAQVVGKDDLTLFPQTPLAKIEEWRANDRRVLEVGAVLQWEESVVQSNELHTYLSTKFPLRNEQGQIYAVGSISTDITARKKTEADNLRLLSDLQHSQALLDTLFDNAPIGIGLWDKNLRFVRVNQALAEMNGLPPEAHYGKTVAELLPQVELDVRQAVEEDVMRTFRQVLETGQPIMNQEAGGETPAQPGQSRAWSVSYYPVIVDGAVEAIGAICEEITERKQVEAERIRLLQLEQAARSQAENERNRLFSLFMQAPIIIALQSGPDLVFEFVHPLTYQIFGNRKLEGLGVREAFPDLEGQGFFELLEGVYHTGQPFIGNEVPVRFVDENGNPKQVYANFTYQPWRNADGDIEGVITVASEVTDQVLARRQLEELNSQKDQFLSVASHDLKTPLTSIQGYVQLLDRLLKTSALNLDDGLRERIQRATSVILRQTDRMNELITRLLDFSRLQNGRLSLDYSVAVNLVELAREVVEQHNIVSAGHDIRLESSQDQLLVDCDVSRIEQVLDNLVGNAIKYSPSDTAITVRLKRQGDEVIVSVQDQGYGIELAQQARLFERFYRVQTPETSLIDGMGLGLYISAEFVTQHGGRMWVESTPKIGSTFYFSLPVQEKVTSDK